jgi:hypothetical protein
MARDLPVREPGAALAAAEKAEAERIIAERDDEIAAQVKAEGQNGGVY